MWSLISQHISTHAPRTGSDTLNADNVLLEPQFQPTLPARGATEPSSSCRASARPFQPTLPARGATCAHARKVTRWEHISTHAPRTGSDGLLSLTVMARGRFQPTLPARGATGSTAPSATYGQFQPTLPARGATGRRAQDGRRHAISTHAPRTGSDETREIALEDSAAFQPTLPARGATVMRRIANSQR